MVIFVEKQIKIAQKNIEIIDSKKAEIFAQIKKIVCSQCNTLNILSNYNNNQTYYCQKCNNKLNV